MDAEYNVLGDRKSLHYENKIKLYEVVVRYAAQYKSFRTAGISLACILLRHLGQIT